MRGGTSPRHGTLVDNHQSSILPPKNKIRYNKRTMITTQNKLITKIGFWAAFVAFVGAVGYIVSVPLQIFNVVTPLQDSIIAFASSLIIPTPFLLAMLVLHSTVSEE